MAIFKRKHAGSATNAAATSRKQASASASSGSASGSGSSSDDDHSDVVVSAVPAKAAPAPRKSGTASSSSKATKQGNSSGTTVKKQQSSSKEPSIKSRSSIEGSAAATGSKKRRLEEPSPPAKKRSRKDDVAQQLQEENEYTVGSSSSSSKKQKTNQKSPSKSSKADQQTSKKRPKNRYYEPPEDIEDDQRSQIEVERSLKPKKKGRESAEIAGRKEKESLQASDNAKGKKASTSAGPTKPTKVQAKRLSETLPTSASKKRRREPSTSSSSSDKQEELSAPAAPKSNNADEESSDSDIVAVAAPSKKASTSTKAIQPPLKKKVTSTSTASPAKTAPSAAKPAKAPTTSTKQYEPYHDSDSEEDVEIIPSIASIAKPKAQAGTPYLASVAPAPIKVTSNATGEGRRSSVAKEHQSRPLQPTVVIPSRKVSANVPSSTSVNKPSKASGSAVKRVSTATSSRSEASPRASTSRHSSTTKRESLPAQAESISSNSLSASESNDDDDVVVAVPVSKKEASEKAMSRRSTAYEAEEADQRKGKAKTVPTPVRKVSKPAPKPAVTSEEEVDELESESDDLVVATVPTSSKTGSAKKHSNAASHQPSSSKSKFKADKNGYVPAFQDTIPGLSDKEDLYPSTDEDELEVNRAARDRSNKAISKSNKGKQPAEEEEDYRPAANTVPTKPSRRPSLRKSDASSAIASASLPVKRKSSSEARFSVEVITRKPSNRKSETEQRLSTSESKPRKQKTAPAPAPATASDSDSTSEDEPAVVTSVQAKAKPKNILNKARKKSTISTTLRSQPTSVNPSPSPPTTSTKPSKVTKSTKSKAPVPEVHEIDSSATESEVEEEDEYALPPPLSFSKMSEMVEEADRTQDKAPVRADSDGSDDEMLLSPLKPLSPHRKDRQSSAARFVGTSHASTSRATMSQEPDAPTKLGQGVSKAKKPKPVTQSQDDEEEAAPILSVTENNAARSPSEAVSQSSPEPNREHRTTSPDVRQLQARSTSRQEILSEAADESGADSNPIAESIRPQTTTSSSKQAEEAPESDASEDEVEIVEAKQSKVSRAKPNAARKTTRPRPMPSSAAVIQPEPVIRQSSSPSASPRPSPSDTTHSAEPDLEREKDVVVAVVEATSTIIVAAGDDSDASAGIFSEAEEEQGEGLLVERTVVAKVAQRSVAKDTSAEALQIDAIAPEQPQDEERSGADEVAAASNGEIGVEVAIGSSQAEDFTPPIVDSGTSLQPDMHTPSDSAQGGTESHGEVLTEHEKPIQIELHQQLRDELDMTSNVGPKQAALDTQDGIEASHDQPDGQQNTERASVAVPPNTSEHAAIPTASRSSALTEIPAIVPKQLLPETTDSQAVKVDQQNNVDVRVVTDAQLEEGVQSSEARLETASARGPEKSPSGEDDGPSSKDDVTMEAADLQAVTSTIDSAQEERAAVAVQAEAEPRERSVEGAALRSLRSVSATLPSVPEVQASESHVIEEQQPASADVNIPAYQPAEMSHDGDAYPEDIPVPDLTVDDVDENEIAQSTQTRSPASTASKSRRPRKAKVGPAKSIDDHIPVPNIPNEYGDDDDEFGLPPELHIGVGGTEGRDRSITQDSANELPSRPTMKPAARRRTREWEKLGTPVKTEDDSSLPHTRPKRDTRKARKSSTVFHSAEKKRERPVRSLSPGKPAPLGFSRGISRGIRKSLAETYSDDDDEDTVTVAKSSTLVNGSKRKSEEEAIGPASQSRNIVRESASSSNNSENRGSLPPFGYNDEHYIDNDNLDHSQSSFLPQGAAFSQDSTHYDRNKPTLQSVRNRRITSDEEDDITVAASTSARYQHSPELDDSTHSINGDAKAATSAHGVSRRSFGGASRTTKRSKRPSPREAATTSGFNRRSHASPSGSNDFEENEPRHDGPSTTSGPLRARKSRLSLQILSEYEVIEPDDVVHDQNDVTVYILEEHEEFEFDMEVDDVEEAMAQAGRGFQQPRSQSFQPPLDEIRRAVASSMNMDIDLPSTAALRNSSSAKHELIGEETTQSASIPKGRSRPGASELASNILPESRRSRKAPVTYREDSVVPETSVEPSTGQPSEGEEDAEGDLDPSLAHVERFSESKLDQWISSFTDPAAETIVEKELAKLFTVQMTFPLVTDKSNNDIAATGPEDFKANLDPHLMLLGWQLQSSSIHAISRTTFRAYMLDEMIDSPERLQRYLQNLWETVFPRVQSRRTAEAADDADPVDQERIPKRYFGFYAYVYGILHESQTQDYPFEAVIATWSCILASYSAVGDDLLEYYTDVLARDSIVTEELWTATLKFVDSVTFTEKGRQHIKGYSQDAYDWPQVMKDYVQWVSSGRQPLPTGNDEEHGQESIAEDASQRQTTVHEASEDEEDAAATVLQANPHPDTTDHRDQHTLEEQETSSANGHDSAAEKAIDEATQEAIAQAKAATSSSGNSANLPQTGELGHSEAPTESAQAQVSEASQTEDSEIPVAPVAAVLSETSIEAVTEPAKDTAVHTLPESKSALAVENTSVEGEVESIPTDTASKGPAEVEQEMDKVQQDVEMPPKDLSSTAVEEVPAIPAVVHPAAEEAAETSMDAPDAEAVEEDAVDAEKEADPPVAESTAATIMQEGNKVEALHVEAVVTAEASEAAAPEPSTIEMTMTTETSTTTVIEPSDSSNAIAGELAGAATDEMIQVNVTEMIQESIETTVSESQPIAQEENNDSAEHAASTEVIPTGVPDAPVDDSAQAPAEDTAVDVEDKDLRASEA